jgi:hypothetical protein
VDVDTLIPVVCNEDSLCSLFEECICPLDCPPEGTDLDGDGVGQCIDCRKNDIDLWATPGVVSGLLTSKGSGGSATLNWTAPLEPGATAVTYDVLRSSKASDFSDTAAVCMADGDPSDTALTDNQVPLFGDKIFFYLARAINGCDQGVGEFCPASGPRSGRDCP